MAYERQGDLALAMQDYDRALRIRPDMEAYGNRGMALLRLSKWDQARADLLRARNMGMDLVLTFRAGSEGIEVFERHYSVELPQAIIDLISAQEAPLEASTGESIVEFFERLQSSVPDSTYDELPSDGSTNYKYYLYGQPQEQTAL